jgi:hypothetical protein
MAAQLQRAAQVLEQEREALEAEQRAHSEAQATSAQLQSTQDSMLSIKVLAGVMQQLEAEQAGHEATHAAL